MQKAEHRAFAQFDEVREFPHVRAAVVKFGNGEVKRYIFEPGRRWSNDVKPIANAKSCEAPHPQFPVSGQLAILIEDGTEMLAGPGKTTSLPSGDDAWGSGESPVVTVDWLGTSNDAIQSESKLAGEDPA